MVIPAEINRIKRAGKNFQQSQQSDQLKFIPGCPKVLHGNSLPYNRRDCTCRNQMNTLSSGGNHKRA